MAAFNEIPKASIYSRRADGKGTLDSAGLWSTLAQRSAAIEDGLLRVGGWSQGDASVVSGAQTVHLGDFLLPAPARPTSADLRVWLAVERTSGSVTYSAQLVVISDEGAATPVPGYSASQLLDAGSTVAFSLDLDLDDLHVTARGLTYAVRVTAVGASGADHDVMAIAMIGRPDESVDGATTPTAWPATSIAQAGDDDTPDAVTTLRRLRDGQAALAGRAPRALASRTPGAGYQIAGRWFGSPGERFFVGTPVIYRYVVWRGNEAGPVTLAMLATDTNADGARYAVYVDAIADQSTPQTVPTPDVDATEVVAATDTTITSDWIVESLSGCWTANTWHVVQVSVWAKAGVDPVSGTGEVRAIVLTEDEYDSAGYLAAGDAMPDGPRVPSHAPGSPIVADLDGAGDADRRTLAATVAWQGWARSQVLAVDSPYAEVSAAGTSAAGTDTDADALWYGRHRLSRGAGGLELWAHVERTGTTNPDRWPRLTLAVDGVATDATLYVPAPSPNAAPGDRQSRWMRLPAFAGVPGATYEFELWGGWYDSDGLTPASGGSESLRLLGVALRETPADHGNLYSANVTTGTDALEDATGFAAIDSTIGTATVQAHTGKRSLGVVCDGTGAGQGVKAAATATRTGTHRASVWLRSIVSTYDVVISLANDTDTTAGPSRSVTLTTDWQRVEVAHDAVEVGDTVSLVIVSDAAVAGGMYADSFELWSA